jgi:hypothetical protein
MPVFHERKSYSDHIKKFGNADHFVPAYVDVVEVLEFLDDIHKRLVTVGHDNFVTPFSNSVDLKRILKGRLLGEDIFGLPYYDEIKRAQ